MRIGICTDLHLGLRQYGLREREEDFYQQYYKAIKIFIKQEVDVVIMGGDLFDQSRPSPSALENLSDGLNDLISNGIDVVNVVGNHTMIQAPGFRTADEFLTTIPSFKNNYHLLNMDYIYHNDDVHIYGLPFHYNYEMNEFIQKINIMNRNASKLNGVNILVIHQSFKEYCGFAGEELSIDDIDTSNFDLVICGHIHEKLLTNLSNDNVFLQPGSLERLSIKEARDEEQQGKGVFIIDTDFMDIDSIANGFIPIKSVRKFLIADMYIKDKKEVSDIRQEIYDKIKDCMGVSPILFLTVHDTSNSFHELVDLTNDMNKDCLTVQFKYFDESQQDDDALLLNQNGDIPAPRDALKIALNPLDENQRRLGLDLYDYLKDGKDVKGLLDDFYHKQYLDEMEELSDDFKREDIESLKKFFEKI